MLIRFVAQNIFSFGEATEFNMLPNNRYKRLPHHKYDVNGFGLLKMTALYGANAAGKSNFVKAVILLKKIITGEKLPAEISDLQFKFRDKKYEDQILAVEFFQDKKSFYYALKINNNIIKTEELYISGLGKKEDRLIFERNTNKEGKTNITFFNEFENDKESQVLKRVIEKNLAKSGQPILKLLTTLNSPLLNEVNIAFDWFESTLQFLFKVSHPALAHFIDEDDTYKNYAEHLINSFHLGIDELSTEKSTLKAFAKDKKYDEQQIIEDVMENPEEILILHGDDGESVAVVRENDVFYVKKLKLKHSVKNKKNITFDISEESDGTVRLLDYVPILHDIFFRDKIFIIDEIENSLHPTIIKELIRSFSEEENTFGQLIFTTHESNLLDQSIFRQDEIWFAQKDKNGSTDLYSLSDYKEHNTIDIRKGYLMGRYGAIPFLSNLKDLNWQDYDISEKVI